MAKNMKAPDAPKDVKKIFSRLFSYYKDYKIGYQKVMKKIQYLNLFYLNI